MGGCKFDNDSDPDISRSRTCASPLIFDCPTVKGGETRHKPELSERMRGKNDRLPGKTDLTVSRLSFGTVFLGPQSDNMSPEEGAALLLHAFKQGVFFWDTSNDYGTHPHVAHALRQVPRDKVVICSKTETPNKPIESILQELETDYLDILLLHGFDSGEVSAAKETLRSWQQHKTSGKVRALGLSTHSARVADLVSEWPEVEVLMLPINSTGYCLPDLSIEGGVEQMMSAAERAFKLGKRIVAMKVMGCGTLAQDPKAAISFVADLPYVHSLCIGMRTRTEIDQNVRLLELNGK
jgi:aryl-alcohol dehydrogenase-like predicted oxidoreductase